MTVLLVADSFVADLDRPQGQDLVQVAQGQPAATMSLDALVRVSTPPPPS